MGEAGAPKAAGMTAPAESGGAAEVPSIPSFLAAGGAGNSFATLTKALGAADMESALQKPGPFTLFAPTDAAFAALPDGMLDELLADPEALRAVLTYHVVPGELPAESVAGMEYARTLSRTKLPIEADAVSVRVGGAVVQAKDLRCANGIVHVVDAVLIPPAEK